jgi:decaprenylphospho-beta-D-erythro-pentofuranosid-2-ulose 2-reductase
MKPKTKQVAVSIDTAVRKKKNIIYVKWFWRWIMLVIRSIPEPIFSKMNL